MHNKEIHVLSGASDSRGNAASYRTRPSSNPTSETHTHPAPTIPPYSYPSHRQPTNFCLYELASAEHLIWMKWYGMWPCCLASLLNTFPRSIHTGACITTSLPFYGWVILYHMGIADFVYWFLHWWKSELFQIGYYDASMNICTPIFYRHMFSVFSGKHD